MKHIGCRSTVYGDETTPLIDVFELDDDEKLLNTLFTQTYENWQALSRKKHREGLKPTEIGKLAELEAVLAEIRGQCRHRVFKDEDGFLYALRSCVTCGAHMGSV